MIDLARDTIGSQPILTIFLAIGIGYLVGQINFGGFSLGVGAVLFVGLALGAFAPKAQITGPISLTGLIMFLYCIGILYGRQFFEGMAGSEGRRYNLLATIGVLAGNTASTTLSVAGSASIAALNSAAAVHLSEADRSLHLASISAESIRLPLLLQCR